MGLGERLKFVRGKISQKDFGTKFGVVPNTVRKYENDEGSPNTDFILAVCKEFNINPLWLLTGEGPTHKDQATEHEAVPEKNGTERQLKGNSIDRCNVCFIEDPLLTDLKLWLNELNGEDPDNQAWFRVELQKRFPEFREWREKKRTPDSFESYGLA